MSLTDKAISYLRAGLCVLPAVLAEKRPAVGSWKPFQQCLPSEAQVAAWFARADALCLLTGAVSGNLEMIDFDAGGALYDRWAQVVESQAPGLLARLVIERSQRGGKHAVYRCASGVCGNMKLAQREGADGRPETLIETRGEGGLFLCAPSPGYEIIQGDLASPPVIDEAQRDVLLSAAWSLNEVWRRQDASPMAAAMAGRPGDDFNERGDIRELLLRHGWTIMRGGENEYWRRPGKSAGSSATLKDRVFYVFSSNAAPFEPQRAYAPFSVYAILEHHGDYAAAASALRLQGYGQATDVSDVDLSAFGAADEETLPREQLPEDPGPVPEDLLNVPGFVRQVMDYTLATAPYPDTVMAFCGAMALQALLAGRKVKDAADNRTSLYLLGLANSGVGKDHPRKVNQRILMQAGLPDAFAETFASGEGIEDRMLVHPAMLFQTDEMDGLITAIAKGREVRFEGIMNVLLKMYTSANGVYAMRIKAGKNASRGTIDQPCLCLFGTAIPTLFYEALSSKMLSNGFFARMLILEACRRSDGQDADASEPPEGVVAIARHWSQLRTASGNLGAEHPQPRTITLTADARAVLTELRRNADEQYRLAEPKTDNVAMAIWARANEKARRLALVYACSENHVEPVIGRAAADWASRLVSHQTRRMLYMAAEHASENEFDAKRKKVLREIRNAPGGRISRTALCRRLRAIPSRERDEVILSLVEAGEVRASTAETAGAPRQEYVAC